MIIYADAEGRILRVLKTEGEIAQYGAPEGYVGSLEIDPETNPLIARHIDMAWNDVRLSSGVLSYKGNPVTVNPSGAGWQARDEAEDARARLLVIIDGALADYAAVLERWDMLTQAQLKAVVKRNAEVLMQLLRYHRRELMR